jgi:hypothetical protein
VTDQRPSKSLLPEVKVTREQHKRAAAMANQMALSYWGLYSAACVIASLQDEVARLETHIIERHPLKVTCESCVRLRTTLTGISTCSTCEACRGAATRALGADVAAINAAVDERLDRVERELGSVHGGRIMTLAECVEAEGGIPFVGMEASTEPLTHQEIFSAVHHHASEIVRLTACVPAACTAQPPGDGQ